MNNLENKMKDALITCHILLSVQWNELGFAENRCRSDKKLQSIKFERDRIQIARKQAYAALRDAGVIR